MKCFIVISALFLYAQYAECYRASVYEHYPSTDETAERTIKKNLELYKNHVSLSRDSTNGFDIVVFPEYGLTGLDPSPLDDYAISIEENTYNVIQEFKDMALTHQVYIVINFLEKEKKSNTKTKYFNTNLVFANNGSIIAKYRKINLFNEDKLTRGEDVVTFKTDFGVTFGIFTSFDIFFKKPSRDVLSNTEVTDIVYPLSWKSVMPFYTTLSIQHGYAVSNGVNFLGASYDQPKKGYGGSSVITFDGKIRDSYIGVTSSSKPIVKELEKRTSRKEVSECSVTSLQGFPTDSTDKPTISDFVTDRMFKASEYNFEKIDLNQNVVFKQICDGAFCCSFNITIYNANTNEVYKVVAFEGKERLGGVDRHVRICSLVACDNDNKDTCGARNNGTTTFKIRVEGNLQKNDNTFYTPITLTYDLKPIDTVSYCEKTNTNTSYIQLFTRHNQRNVLAFGIYGFDNTSSAFAIKNSVMFLFILVAVRFIFL